MRILRRMVSTVHEVDAGTYVGVGINRGAPRGTPSEDSSARRLRERVARFSSVVDTERCDEQLREAFEVEFRRLRPHLRMYPPSPESKPAAVFEVLAHDAREVASECLPLAIALSMHWYPLCVLQCSALPLLSKARLQRVLLLAHIRRRALIVANTGGERSCTPTASVRALRFAKGFVLRGTHEYMSLANVADAVFLKAAIEGEEKDVLCLVNIRGAGVKIGPPRFSGSMRLSNTASIEFDDCPLSRGSYVVLPRSSEVECLTAYQRSWFHLFIAEIYTARILHLCLATGLPMPTEERIARNEIAHLRRYCLSLLDCCDTRASVDLLLRATSTLKLRVSRFAKSASAMLEPTIGEQNARLRSDVMELQFISRQPTTDLKLIDSV